MPKFCGTVPPVWFGAAWGSGGRLPFSKASCFQGLRPQTLGPKLPNKFDEHGYDIRVRGSESASRLIEEKGIRPLRDSEA